MSWFKRHHSRQEYVVCKRCCSLFLFKEATKLQLCPKCNYSPNQEKDTEQQASLDRIHAKMR